MNTENYEDILARMKNHMIAGQSKVTDFNAGSIIMTLFESVARPLEQAYVDTRNGYYNNLCATAFSVFNFERKNGTYASVSVKFSRASAGDNTVVVLSGTKLSDGSHTFSTTSNAVIQAGDTESALVSAIADEVGNEYNVAPETVTTIEGVVPMEVVGVTNPTRAYGGSDRESDADMLARFRVYINGLQGTNHYGIKAGVLAIPEVRSVGIEEHIPPKNNIYNLTVYADDGTGQLADSVKDTIVSRINGDDTAVNPGLRAAGIQVDVQPATEVPIAISVTCKVYRTEEAKAQADILQTLEEEINKLGINENVVWTNVILALRRIGYIKDVQNLLINNDSENITIDVNEIARFSSADITVDPVE